MPQRVAKRIYHEILQAEHLILVPHQNPDGDALGSVTALADFFTRISKPFTIFCATGIPDNLRFLEHTDNITSNPNVWKTSKQSTIILLDSGDMVYAGVQKLIDGLRYDPIIINIDHHATNQQFGTHNLVIEGASSTTEILYMFFRHNNIEISPEMATSLMTGLITDTGNFSNAGTSRHALAVASDLSRKHANVGHIRTNVFKNKSVQALKLWGRVLSRLHLNERHGIAYTYYTNKDIEEFNVTEEELDGIANLLNDLNEGHAIMVLRERADGSIKGSLRTTKNNVDVSMIAQAFDGGGHVKASGFTILEHNIESAIEHIFDTLTVKELAFVKV